MTRLALFPSNGCIVISVYVNGSSWNLVLQDITKKIPIRIITTCEDLWWQAGDTLSTLWYSKPGKYDIINVIPWCRKSSDSFDGARIVTPCAQFLTCFIWISVKVESDGRLLRYSVQGVKSAVTWRWGLCVLGLSFLWVFGGEPWGEKEACT